MNRAMLALGAALAIAAILSSSRTAAQARSAPPLQALVDAAPEGSTLLLPSGIHRGPIVVSKRLELVGAPDAEIAVGAEADDPSFEGDALRIAADDVVVRGLRVRGSGSSLAGLDAGIYARGRGIRIELCEIRGALFGVRLDRCEDSSVSGCAISGRRGLAFAARGDGIRVSGGSGIAIADTRISYACDGIYLDGTASPRIARCEVSDGRYGLHVMYGSGAAVEGLSARRMIVGAMVMGTEAVSISRSSFEDGRDPRSAGVVLFESEGCSCRDSRMSSQLDGVLLSGARGCRLERNLVSGNARGITLEGDDGGCLVAGNAFIGNRQQVAGPVGLGSLAWSEAGRGNYWDDYRGYDFDDDGIGDSPYRRPRSYGALGARVQLAAIFFGSPLQRAVDDLDPSAEIVDPSPLIKPPDIGRKAGSAGE